jgi:hypothetical protein
MKLNEEDQQKAREIIGSCPSLVLGRFINQAVYDSLREHLATALTEKEAETWDEAIKAFRQRAVQAAKKLQIGGLNRSAVYNMLIGLEVQRPAAAIRAAAGKE